MRFAKLGDVIHKSAARTGASAEAMSGLQKAAELSGATLTDVERAMKRSNEAIDDAIHKGGEAADAFERLGLSADELQKMIAEERFHAIAAALKSVGQGAEQAALAGDIFGRAGFQLLPMINSDLEAITNRLRELNATLSQQDADNAAELTDAMADLKDAMQGIALQVGAALAPVLTDLIKKILPIVVAISEWIENNHQLVRIVAAVAASITGLGVALMTFGTTVALLGFAISGVSAAIAFLATPIGIAIAAVSAIVVAIGAAATAFFTLTEAGREMSRNLGEYFKWLLRVVSATVSNIFGAIAKGNFKEAFRIALAGVVGIVGKTMQRVFNVMVDMITSLIARMKELANSISRAAGQGDIFDVEATRKWGRETKRAYDAAVGAALAYATATGKAAATVEQAGGKPEDYPLPTESQPRPGSSIPGTFSAAASVILGRNMREGNALKQIAKNTAETVEAIYELETGVPVT